MIRYIFSICLFFSLYLSAQAEEAKVWSVRNVFYTDAQHKTATPLTSTVVMKADVKLILKESSYILLGTQSPFAFIEVKKAGVYLYKDLWLKKYAIADTLVQHANSAYEVINGTYKDPYGMNRPGAVYRFGPEKMKLWYMKGDVEMKTRVLPNKPYTLHWTALNESFKTPKADIRNLFGDLLAEPAIADQQLNFTFRTIEKTENQFIITWSTENPQDDPFERMFILDKDQLIYPEFMEKKIVASGNSDFSLLIAAEYCKSKGYFVDAADYYLRVKEAALLQHIEK